MDWTYEQISELTRLWGEGHSASEIGRQMGLTRNQIIGKAHRLDLEKRPSPIKRRDYVRLSVEELNRRRRDRYLRRMARESGVVVTLKPKAKRVATMEWSSRPLSATQTCQHIEGDPKMDPTKCGKPAVEAKPYCADHCAACYVVYAPKAQAEAA
jgi:GcrA cell cycle regulator